MGFGRLTAKISSSILSRFHRSMSRRHFFDACLLQRKPLQESSMLSDPLDNLNTDF